MKKNKYMLFIIVLSVITLVVSIFMGIYFILGKEKQLFEKKYSNLSINLIEKVNSLIHTKQNATLSIAITLAENEKIKDALLSRSSYDLVDLSKKLKDNTDFKNVWFHLVDKDGISIYRSWTADKFDKVKNIRIDLQELYKNPKIESTISIGKYDITFKSIVPVYHNRQFIGILEIITHFNSITKFLEASDNLDSFMIVQKEFTKQLKENNFSKIFLKDFYVANISANEKTLKYLEKQDLETIFESEEYIIKDGYFIINIPIFQSSKKLANFLIVKKLDTIDISEIELFKIHSFWYLTFFVVLLCTTIFLIGYFIYSRKLKELNIYLQKTVSDEISKNDEKNLALFQQNKMAAMGEMIGNIAHQWRQPLSVITTVASSLKLKKEYGVLDDKENEEALVHIIDTANYLSNTIDDFRYYFSPNNEKNLFNTKVLLKRCLNMVSIDFSNKNIKIVKNIEEFTVYSFENELSQVIINILNNAKDELSKVQKEDERLIFLHVYKETNFLIIKIKDSAGGIKDEIIHRIFEPYFTTKHKSKGTGIGLYMSQEIIVKHIKGTIEVFNEEYTYNDKELKGALFKLSIPID
jgi:two-component system, NtrC family, C4-dicarboxylate transport sensor histidine kinase DctB